ncbi:MAG: hypothetical protein ACXVCP_19655 [Bdellovibrio sp.]
MRQLLTVLAVMLVFQNAYSFQDKLIIDRTKDLLIEFDGSPQAERLQYLEQYKDFLYKRLNTINIPNLLNLPDNDPRLLEYGSLTEYDGYIDLINMQHITVESCHKAIKDIQANGSIGQGKLAAEARIAIKIVTALCK